MTNTQKERNRQANRELAQIETTIPEIRAHLKYDLWKENFDEVVEKVNQMSNEERIKTVWYGTQHFDCCRDEKDLNGIYTVEQARNLENNEKFFEDWNGEKYLVLFYWNMGNGGYCLENRFPDGITYKKKTGLIYRWVNDVSIFDMDNALFGYKMVYYDIDKTDFNINYISSTHLNTIIDECSQRG